VVKYTKYLIISNDYLIMKGLHRSGKCVYTDLENDPMIQDVLS
jgi:hypothetical protein